MEHIKLTKKTMTREETIKKQAEDYADKHGFRVPYDGSNNFYDETDVKASLEGLCNNIMKKLKIPEGERIVAMFEDNDHDDIVGWAVYDEDGPITDIMQTEELENWRDHITFNVKGTYSSVEHGKDGTVTLHDIKIEGIDLE